MDRPEFFFRAGLLFLFQLFFINTYCQHPNYYNFSLQQGLPSSETYAVYQDSKGFIWFATDAGVARFDGNEIESFTTKDGLVDPVIFGFYEDDSGRLWFRSFSGNLSYFQDGEIKEYRYNEKLSKLVSSDIVYSILFEKGTLWFSSGHLMGKIDSLGKADTLRILPYQFRLKKINDDYLFGSNGTSAKIRVAIANDQVYHVIPSDTINHHKVLCVISWKNNTYISINTDVFQWDGNSFIKVFTAKKSIIRLYKDDLNNLWIGYLKGGTERFASDEFTNPFRLSILNDQSVTGILKDSENGIWLTTLESGAFYIANPDFEFYEVESRSKVTAVISHGDFILTGTQDGFLKTYDSKSKKIITNTPIPGGTIVSLFKDQKNKVWISNSKTYLFDLIRQSPSKTYEQSAFAFATGPEAIWTVGGLRLSKYSEKGEILMHNLTRAIHRLIFVRDSLVYTAERIGIDIYDSNGNFLSRPDNLKKYKVTSISSLNDTTLLIATVGNGILLYNEPHKSVIQYNSNNKLNANNIYSCISADTSVWLGTENGLIVIPKRSLTSGKIFYKQVTQKGGLKNNKINHLCLTRNSVWVFSDEGHTIIPFTFFANQQKSPVFYLKQFLINDEVTTIDHPDFQLPYFKNNLRLQLGFIGFNNQAIICRYKLFKNDNWKFTSNRVIQLPSLSNGKYSLKLEYSVNNSRWINSGLNMNFEILPPVWERWYFITGIFTIIFGAIILVLTRIERQKRNHLQQLYSHQQKLLSIEIETLERERTRISKDLHDGVGNNLIVLKMKIYQFLSKLNPSPAREFEKQFQEVITEIKKIIFELTPPGFEQYGLFSNLTDYVEKLRTTGSVEVDFYTSGEDIISAKKNILIFRIIQELVTNSLKHSGADKITLHLNSFEKELNIIYQDNGSGFTIHSIKNGFGLLNIESRIESMGGNMQKDSGDFGVSFIINIPK